MYVLEEQMLPETLLSKLRVASGLHVLMMICPAPLSCGARAQEVGTESEIRRCGSMQQPEPTEPEWLIKVLSEDGVMKWLPCSLEASMYVPDDQGDI